MRRAGVVIATSTVAVLCGVFSVAVARDEPAYSFSGASPIASVALVGAGWMLIGAGVASWLRRQRSLFGPLLAAAGFASFLLEWDNPRIGSSLAFSVGLALSLACPPLVANALLAYPGGRLSWNLARGVVALAYIGNVLLLGVLPALLFDPRTQGCNECPRNLLQVGDSAAWVRDLERAGVWIGLGWSVATAGLLALKLGRASGAARRADGPVLGAGAAYLGLVAATFAVSLDRGLVVNGTLERRLWLGESAALVGVALGVGWCWVRLRRARGEVARLVVALVESPPPGGLRDVLAGIIGDPELVLAYPLAGSGRLVDARGRTVELDGGHERTSLVRDGREVAVLAHKPRVLDDQLLVEEVTASARLVLENERLQGEVQARLEKLRASRARIIEAGDAERKRLERDLHDGAQQRLVGASLSLRLLRSTIAGHAGDEERAQLEAAEDELRMAIAELRELAHGIFPAVLADQGLAAAVEALTEEAPVPIRVRTLPEGRFPAAVETAAYTVCAEAAKAAARGVSVSVERTGGLLVVDVEADDSDGRLAVTDLEDRVGAVDGRVAVSRGATGVRIRAELPCES